MQHDKAMCDPVWSLIDANLPPALGRPCRPAQDNRTIFGAMAWLALTGTAWRQLPARLGNWNSVHRRYRRWMNDGIFEVVLGQLAAKVDANPSDAAARQAYRIVALVCSNLEARDDRTRPAALVDAPESDPGRMADCFFAELFGAYLDGELDEPVKGWLEDAMQSSPQLAIKLVQWRANDACLRELVRQVDQLPLPARVRSLLVSGAQGRADD